VNPAGYQTFPITCPNCNNRFMSPVLSIVDVGQNPEAKTLLLSGQLNIAVCPQCGHAGMLSSPLVYHDPEKELFLTFVPSELGLADMEQQRLIGDLTNKVMSSLAAEQRKGYLLRPRSFMRLEAMLEAILEADGITPEMLKAQRAKAALLDRLVRASNEDERRAIAQENDEQIDYEFFQILSMNLELAEAGGEAEAAEQLLRLRTQLLAWTTSGREVSAREEAIRELGPQVTREDLLDKLVEAALAGESAKVETMVAFARPAIDYIFYQQLTGRIEALEGAGQFDEAETLKALRETVLDLIAEIDAELQRASEQAARLLQQILDSDDLEGAIRTNLGQIDDLFLNVFAARLQEAEQAGHSETALKLRQVGDILTELIRQSQPPEIQFINELLSVEYPEATQTLLEGHREQVNDRLLEIMRMIAADLDQSGREKAAQRLLEIQQQAAALVD
jgi:hypothetical protein